MIRRKRRRIKMIITRLGLWICLASALALIAGPQSAGADNPGKPGEPARPEMIISYDDGSPDDSFSFNRSFLKYSNMFDVVRPCQVLELHYYIAQNPGQRFNAAILDSTLSGEPGTYLLDPFEVRPGSTGWFVVDVSDYAIEVEDRFFVSLESLFEDPYFGYDDEDNGHAWGEHFLDGWVPMQGTYFVRALVLVEGGTCFIEMATEL